MDVYLVAQSVGLLVVVLVVQMDNWSVESLAVVKVALMVVQ